MRKEKETLSLISEQIQKLRDLADDPEIDMYGIRELKDICKEVADTIETLSAKLASANMERSSAHYNGEWIPVKDMLPEESGEYLTYVEYDGRRFISIDEIDCDDIIKEWNFRGKIFAWMPLPEPYKE